MEYGDLKWYWNAPFATPEAKKFLGEGPKTPLKEDVPFGAHLTNMCIHCQARHYALSDLLVKPHFDP